MKPTHWLHDFKIHASKILLKRSFPLVDGLQDPVVIGPMVIPARSEFVQVINYIDKKVAAGLAKTFKI